jgi:hypothetical protein
MVAVNGHADTEIDTEDVVEEQLPPTRTQARQARHQEQDGFWFPLPRTGGAAHVRVPNIFNRIELDALPDTIQQEVARAVRQAQNTTRREPTIGDVKKNLGKSQSLADMLCVACFVKPKLVMRDEDLDDDPYTMLVTDLHARERLDFGNLCFSMDEEAAKRLKPFRAQPTQPVPDRAPEPVVAETVDDAEFIGVGV